VNKSFKLVETHYQTTPYCLHSHRVTIMLC